MDRRPRFEYDVSSVFEGTISSPSWLPSNATVGGSRTSSAGIPAAFKVRSDELARLTLRFWEDEWPAVRAFIAFAQTGQSFDWLPDADEPTSFAVYLESPLMGEPVSPTRDGTFPRVMELAILLRNASATAPWTPYFADRLES